jgi:phage terminase large subunit-like protein
VGSAEEQRSYTSRGLEYCHDVLSGKIPACKWTKAAARRHLDDLERESTSDFYFDDGAVEHVCAFVEALPQIKGEWARRREYVRLQDWQVFILAVIFGWKRRADGMRRFRIAYVECARKNGKSTLLAAIALYLLAADGETGAEVYSLATTRDQAAIVFSTAKQMSLREPDFREAFAVEVNAHNLWIEESGSKLQALSADGSVLDGLNISGAIVDELHAHPTREVWDVIETATGSRTQPLITTITTAGTNRAGICYEQRSYVCRILNSTLRAHKGLGYREEGDSAEDDSYFGIIFTLDEDDDWTDESVWIKANPNLGVSVKLDDMQRLARKAMQMASAQPNFLTKRLDMWVNADSAWMDMRAWDRAADQSMRMEDFRGWDCYIGLDLASKTDITSMPILFTRGGEYRLFSKNYLPEEAVEESSNSQYKGWVAAGKLIETEGNIIDEAAIESDFKQICSEYKPKAVGFDPGHGWNFCARMANEGYPMVEVRAYVLNFSEPMRFLEALVLGGKLKHDGNPVSTWMISNVVCHRDAKDNIYPRKEREEAKIDFAIGAIIAIGRALSNTQSRGWFELHGLATI